MEVMVAVGIGGIVTLGVTSMLQNTAKMQIESRAQFEKNQISLLFESIIVDPVDCTQTILGGVSAGNPEDSPVTAGRKYLPILSTANITFPALKRVDAKGDVVDVVDMSSFPVSFDSKAFGPGKKGYHSRVQIKNAYLTNFKVLSNRKMYTQLNPGTDVDYVPRSEVEVPSSGVFDLVVELDVARMGSDAGKAGIVNKTYRINKIVPVTIAQERPGFKYNGKNYISGCAGGEDVGTENIDRLVCDSLAAGNALRDMSNNTGPYVPKWGASSYVDCKDVVRVRKRMIKMLLCREVGGKWNTSTFKCEKENNQKFVNNQNCPSGKIVFQLNMDGASTNTYEPLLNPPGDHIIEKLECRNPCWMGGTAGSKCYQ